jgi:hypothetical protein
VRNNVHKGKNRFFGVVWSIRVGPSWVFVMASEVPTKRQASIDAPDCEDLVPQAKRRAQSSTLSTLSDSAFWGTIRLYVSRLCIFFHTFPSHMTKEW